MAKKWNGDQLSLFEPLPPPRPSLLIPRVGTVWLHKYPWMKVGRLLTIYQANEFIVCGRTDKQINCTLSIEDWYKQARMV